MKKTTFNDVRDPNCEARKYILKRQGLEAPSSVTWYFDCPFCGIEIRAYLWSLSGGGKRCSCGAIFGARGVGYKLKEQNENTKQTG